MVPVPLRGADAEAGRHLDHAVALPPADLRDHAGRCQGRLPLSQQCARTDGGAGARFRQLPACATCSATLPSSRPPIFSSARTASCTRRSPNGTFLAGITRQRVIKLLRGAGVTVVEGDAALQRFRDRRRDLLVRQLLQGDAGGPDRRPLAAARSALSQGARAVLGICARVTRKAWAPTTQMTVAAQCCLRRREGQKIRD